ncbi:hypothetical protein HXX76_014691 [Chlamydomonas incerta]|uniref:Thioredoxin domain-containing protein n=1 Tax=Chlamydomonas incerta TaxID=51695 RepID=A0A835SIN0_CHLIN|nr:hypothetical protein HXX76_014691 [Chlamydomonas incerta]|eukprot:KAG2424158.1 hypothetical protein HXX76_014691 [Chlamydomonas incerta]
MSAMATPCVRASPSAGALRSGRAARAAVRPVAVAVPRKRLAAPPASAATASAVTATEQAVAEVTIANGVHILTADTYHGFLDKHAEKLIVTDFYAVWCGPCKVIAPEIERLANEMDASQVVFAKMDCGATNESKKLAMALNIKALPTFHLYRNSKQVDSMTGAKIKALTDLIGKHL